MTKTEKTLIEAIEVKDYDLSLQKFEEFQALKSTTDEQAQYYFNQIEALQNNVEKKEEVEQPKVEVEAITELDGIIKNAQEFIDLSRNDVKPETRGRKAKDVDRKEIENDLEALINKTLSFNQKVSRDGSGDSRFAKRISRDLVNIRKRLVR